MRLRTLVGLAVVAPAVVGAQQTDTSAQKDTVTSSSPSTAPAAAPAPAPAAKDDKAAGPQFSGVVFANYMYQTGKDVVVSGTHYGRGMNAFNFERAYITATEKLSDRTSVRVTTDVYPISGSGYGVRLKYGYLQYDYLKSDAWNALARFGMVHTAVIDHEENFWPRWIAKTPTDMLGYFSSADLGLATLIKMPSKMGEVYAVVSNGTGYGNVGDANRFKDYEARLTLTPFASSTGFLKTFDLSGWYYKGAQAASTDSTLTRDRWGAFIGIKDPRVMVGLNYSERKDEPTAGVDSTGRVLSAYTHLHPFATAPFGIVLRYDQIKPNTSLSQNYSVFIGGLTYDLSKRASISADYQELGLHSGATLNSTAVGYLGAPRAAFMHVVVNF